MPPPAPEIAPNARPLARFAFAPEHPRVGQHVTFSSLSTDSDGSVTVVRWDLDDDKRFDDAEGTIARWSFSRPGEHTVGVKVTDDRGGASTVARAVQVRPVQPSPPPAPPTQWASSPPPPPQSAPAPGLSPGTAAPARPRLERRPLMSPFPIIRARGRILRGGVVIDILSVRAAAGAHITVRCQGRGCRTAIARARIPSGRSGVRVRAYERWLPVGTVLKIFVTRAHHLGKYTRFVILRSKPPTRRDLCVRSVRARPLQCPA